MPVIRKILFLFLFAFLFWKVSSILEHKEDRIICNRYFFQKETEQFDVLGIGSSYLYCTLNPIILYRDTGLRSFVLASPNQQIEVSYHFLKEALKRQKPKLIILEASWVVQRATKVGYAEGNAHTTLDAFPIGLCKHNLIQSLDLEGATENYYLPFLKYHIRWKDINKGDFDKFTPHNHPAPISFFGFQMYTQSMPVESSSVSYNESTPGPIYGPNLEYLERIVHLIHTHGADLLLLFGPKNLKGNGYENRRVALDAWARETHIPILDFNVVYDDVGFDSNTDFLNTSHLNVYGAEKATAYLAQYLTHHYSFKPTISETSRTLWDAEGLRYDEAKIAKRR